MYNIYILLKLYCCMMLHVYLHSVMICIFRTGTFPMHPIREMHCAVTTTMLQVLQTLAFATPLAERLYPTFGGLMRHPGLEKMWMADVVPSRVHFFCLLRVISRISSSTLVDVMLARIKTLESLEPPAKWPNISGYFRYIPWCFPRNPITNPTEAVPFPSPPWQSWHRRNRSSEAIFEALQPPQLANAEAIRLRVFCCATGPQWNASRWDGKNGRQWGYHMLPLPWPRCLSIQLVFQNILDSAAFVLICSLWPYMLLTVCSTCQIGVAAQFDKGQDRPQDFNVCCTLYCRPQDFGFLLVSW